MKMNLSLVMGIKDKTTPILRGMSSESDHYAKSIKKVQKAQADDSAAMGMIDSYQKSNKMISKNAISIAAASEKLKELKDKTASVEKPSAALTEKITKQQEKLSKLTNEQEVYKNHLGKLDKQLKKTGVNTQNLDDEYGRLDKSYQSHGKEISRLSKRYTALQKAMKPINKLSSKIKMPKVGAAVAGKGAALLGGFSLAGLVTQVNSAANEMDGLAKSANTLNMPISELQAMQSQAEHAGVSSDALTGSMTRFTKRLGVLQETGSGALGSFLKKSGSSLHEGLKEAGNTQQAYEMLLEEFGKLKSPQEEMAFADAAFGQEGRKMLIMLREGAGGLNAARDELHALGGGAKAEDAAKAEAYNDALQKIQESVRSMKFAALAPIMEKVTKVFTAFSDKFKNADWRTEFIEKIIRAVDGLYRGLEFLGKVLIFVSQNFKEILAAVALFKIGLIALNAVVMANPIGLIVAAIGAAIVAITYLADKFIGLDTIIKWVGEQIGWLWDKFKRLINMLPDSLIPDGWKVDTDEASRSVDNLANKINGIKDKKATLGITTNEVQNKIEDVRTQQYYSVVDQNEKAQSAYGSYSYPSHPQAMTNLPVSENAANDQVQENTTNEVINQRTNRELFERTTTEQNDSTHSQTNEQLEQTQLINHQVIGADKIKAQAEMMTKVKNHNVELGLTTNEVTSQTKRSFEEKYYSAVYQNDEPLTHQPYNPYVVEAQVTGTDKLKAQAKLMKEMKNRNVELGITTNETVNQSVNQPELDTWDTSADYFLNDIDQNYEQSLKQQERNNKYQPLGQSSLSGGYKPLTAQAANSKSEIDLRIKSDKPVTVERAKVSKHIDLNLDVGNIATSF